MEEEVVARPRSGDFGSGSHVLGSRRFGVHVVVGHSLGRSGAGKGIEEHVEKLLKRFGPTDRIAFLHAIEETPEIGLPQ